MSDSSRNQNQCMRGRSFVRCSEVTAGVYSRMSLTVTFSEDLMMFTVKCYQVRNVIVLGPKIFIWNELSTARL